jgi:tetratricopeptide (TPR) repeat protein
MARVKKKFQPQTVKRQAVVIDSSFAALTALLLLLVAGAFAWVTYARNSIYHTHVTLWAEVARTAPNKRRAHENFGQALSTAGSLARSAEEANRYYDEALKQFEKVQELRDDGSVPLRDLYREIGVVYFRTGRYDEAVRSWQTGLRFAPYDPSLLNNLSIALMQQGGFEEAASYASTALMADPNMPQALNTMGQVSMMKKDYEKAVNYFMKAIDVEPDVPARYWNVALALEQTRKYDLAMQYTNRFISMERNPGELQRAYQYQEHLKSLMRH